MRAQRQAQPQFPVRIRIAVPPEGLGRQLERMHAWLDETCGREGWTTALPGWPALSMTQLLFISRTPPSRTPLSPAFAAAIASTQSKMHSPSEPTCRQ
jgi:hypothetical protein